MELKIRGYILVFDCERCGAICRSTKDDLASDRKCFCGHCGACYEYYFDKDNRLEFRRVKYGDMCFPLPEWLDIFLLGKEYGRAAAIDTE